MKKLKYEGPILQEDEIYSAVWRLATRITKEYQGKNILLLSVLKGSVVFLADLMRDIKLPLDYTFVKLSLYGEELEVTDYMLKSAKVELLENYDLSQYDVILVEDIIDSGWTSYLVARALAHKCKSFRVVALLQKDRDGQRLLGDTWVGEHIQNVFVAGYGMDASKQYRNLPYIGVFSEEKDDSN